MEISSSAFKNGEKIPVSYVMPGAGGKNIPIPLTWKAVPPGTKSAFKKAIEGKVVGSATIIGKYGQ